MWSTIQAGLLACARPVIRVAKVALVCVVKPLTSAAKAFFAIKSCFALLLSRPGRLANGIATTSAVVTGGFYLASRGSTLQAASVHTPSQLPANRLIMLFAGLGGVSSLLSGWGAWVYVLSDSMTGQIAAIVPALGSLTSFKYYNLYRAQRNMQKLKMRVRRGEITKPTLLIGVLLTSIAGLGYTAFNFLLTKTALQILFAYGTDDEIRQTQLAVAGAGVLASGTFVTTALSRCTAVILFHTKSSAQNSEAIPLSIQATDDSEIDFKTLWRKKSSLSKVGIVSLLLPINLYELCSTLVGYYTAGAISVGVEDNPLSVGSAGCLFVALLSAYLDCIFTQLPATKAVLMRLGE